MNKNENIEQAPASQLNSSERLNVLNVIGANTRLDCALLLLNTVDFSVINKTIESTPDELKSGVDYQYLVASSNFVKILQEINNNYKEKANLAADSDK